MEELSFLRALGQVFAGEAGEVFRDFLRGSVRQMICDVMAAEVNELCDAKHSPASGDKYRAGNAPGRVLIEGDREEVTRPRVRERQSDGTIREVALDSDAAANDPEQQFSRKPWAEVLHALVSGVSTREVVNIKPNSPVVSRSNVSRLCEEAGGRLVDELRIRALSGTAWCVLMLDGIRLSKDQVAVVAIGIAADGSKHVLDFSLGSSEKLETARELLARINRRGFNCALGLFSKHRLFVFLDGSGALRSAVKEHFPDSVVQRCLLHKERNIKGKLSKRHWVLVGDSSLAARTIGWQPSMTFDAVVRLIVDAELERQDESRVK